MVLFISRLGRRIFWFVTLVLAAGAAFAQSNESRPETEIVNRPKAAAREVIVGREVPSAAPFNPRFVEYLEERARGIVRPMTTADGHGLGLIPSPLDSSHLQGQPLALSAVSFPASYDLRAGKMTPVKDQGSCGACWAFAAYGSLESVLLPAETWDFSENNLKDLSGIGFSPCGGGFVDSALAYLARWGSSSFQAGPVIESDDPYQPTDTNTSPPFPPGASVQKHVQDITKLAPRQNATDNDALKNAFMQYGGVWTGMLWSDGAYNPATYSYYYDGSTPVNAGHAVTLAGWDDNYPASKFLKPPPGDGAFLAKNSFGASWGDSGYFWISYYDQMLATGDSWVIETVQPVTNYTRQYQYDPLGWVDSRGFNSTTGWFKNVFTAAANEELRAVATYVASNSSPYSIYVFTGNTLAGQANGVFPSAGYHTVELPAPVALAQGQQFTVQLELTTPGYNWPIPISQAPAVSPGQSYISPDGQQWTDTIMLDPSWAIHRPGTTSVALKAFTNLTPDFTMGPASGSPTSRTITAGQTTSFSLAFTPIGSFTGTVNLSCRVSPAVALAPTCTLPPSVQIGGSGTQMATVEVATFQVMASRAVSPGAMPWLWTSMALGLALLRLRTRPRGGVLAAPAIILALTLGLSCGGGSGSSPNITTPPGTYAVAITATSGSLSHNT
ncbi:MAG: lectin like domain-containing protein, partial [Chlamydiota bacterium]